MKDSLLFGHSTDDNRTMFRSRGDSATQTCFAAVLLSSLLTSVPPTPAYGQDAQEDKPADGATLSPIATDRPGNGNASSTVGRGRMNVETGVNYALLQGDGADAHQVTAPVALRLGLVDPLEVRALASLFGFEERSGQGDAEAVDFALGLKLQLLESDALVPELAVMTDVFLPTGSGSFTSGVVVPEFRVAAAWALPAGFGFFTNLGVDVPDDAASRFGRLIHLAQLNWATSLGANQAITLFVESYGRTAFEASREFFQIDAGLLLLLTPNLQLDAFTQHGVSGFAPDFQASLGFSARI